MKITHIKDVLAILHAWSVFCYINILISTGCFGLNANHISSQTSLLLAAWWCCADSCWFELSSLMLLLILGCIPVCLQPLTRGHARSQHQAPHVTGLAWLHQRSASALGSSTSCINMSCHYHSEAPKSLSCQPKAGLRTHAAVCVWFGGVSGMWSTRLWCASAHSRSGSTHRAQKANRGTLRTDEDTPVHLSHCPDILTKKYDLT